MKTLVASHGNDDFSVNWILLSLLQHWEHLCECKIVKLRLLYRHSLVELFDLALSIDNYTSEEKALVRNIGKSSSCPDTLTKKVWFFSLFSHDYMFGSIYLLLYLWLCHSSMIGIYNFPLRHDLEFGLWLVTLVSFMSQISIVCYWNVNCNTEL